MAITLLRQMDKSRENDHGPTQRPQYDQERDAIIKVELPSEAPRNDQFQENQPNAAAKEEER